jgi:intraflagellar transport protein 172
VRLQEEWGEHLVSTGQTDNAISHFIEAGATVKAAKAALAANNLPRAGSLIEVLTGDEQEVFSGELAALHQASGNLSAAAKYYVIAGRATAAVHMYFDANLWDEAHKVRCFFKSAFIYWRIIALEASNGSCCVQV